MPALTCCADAFCWQHDPRKVRENRIPGTTSGVPVSCRTKCRGKPPRARWAFDLTVPTSVSDENCGGGDGRAMNPNVQAPDLAVDMGAVHIRPSPGLLTSFEGSIRKCGAPAAEPDDRYCFSAHPHTS